MENKTKVLGFGIFAVLLLSVIGYTTLQWQHSNAAGLATPRSDQADDVVQFMVEEYSARLESVEDIIFAHSMQQGLQQTMQNEECITHPSSVAIFNAYSVSLKQNIHSQLNARMFALYKGSHPDRAVDMAGMPVVMSSHGVIDAEGDEPTHPLAITFAWAPDAEEFIAYDPPVIIVQRVEVKH